ncbi:MAG: zinc ribbon domain-containing protein [Clostridia bacterium]
MMYCKYCGKEVESDAMVCVHCGRSLKECEDSIEDSGHFGWGVLGFFVPLAGLILYILWRTEKPKNSTAAGRGALISACFIVGLFILSILVVVIIFASAATSQGVFSKLIYSLPSNFGHLKLA